MICIQEKNKNTSKLGEIQKLMKVIRKLRNRFLPVYNRLLKVFHAQPPILSNEETIRQLAEGKSLGRFGDGEMMLILKQGDLAFQKQDPTLQARLEEVLSSTEGDFLVGLPGIFTDKDLADRNEASREFWEINLLATRREWYRRIHFSHHYANSTFTRNYVTLKDKSAAESYFHAVKSIWESRKVLVIEGSKSRVGVGNSLFSNAAEIKRILCPSVNAFDAYQEILAQACSAPKDYLILIALGPTATVLAYDLHMAGYQAIDIGHIDIEFEWFLHQSDQREQIPGKYVAEAGGMEEDTLQDDQLYRAQIIQTVGTEPEEKSK